MTRFQTGTVFFSALGFFLVSFATLPWAASDNTLGMALMSASIQFDGTIKASSGVTSTGSVKDSTGSYTIHFDRDLSACTCTASFGTHNSAIAINAGQSWISASCPWTGGDSVGVSITYGGVSADRDFQVIVFCPK